MHSCSLLLLLLHPAACSLPFLPALRRTCRRFDRLCVCVFRTPVL
jgi:hypothetical protein